MARIILPVNFSQQQKLRDDIDAKVSADGPSGELLTYITQQNISLPATATAAIAAKGFEDSRFLLDGNAANYRQLRDNLFARPWKNFQAMAQYLKTFYRGSVAQLVDWGIPVAGNKLAYPVDFAGKAAMMSAFYNKHSSFPAGSSPLEPCLTKQNIVIAADSADLANAVARHKSFENAAGQAEHMREQRDNEWLPVMSIIQGITAHLKTMYGKNPQGLIAYGIHVDESPQAPKMRKTALKLGENITINAATIGGHFKNTGTTDLHLYRGKTTTGTPVIIKAGDDYGIQKGWSTMTVVNPDLLNGGKFEVLSAS